jgi:hypothetical protein
MKSIKDYLGLFQLEQVQIYKYIYIIFKST